MVTGENTSHTKDADGARVTERNEARVAIARSKLPPLAPGWRYAQLDGGANVQVLYRRGGR